MSSTNMVTMLEHYLAAGETVSFGMWKIQERGKLFFGANVKIYEGMIIGIHARDNDLVVNATREKKLTNVRSVRLNSLLMMSW